MFAFLFARPTASVVIFLMALALGFNLSGCTQCTRSGNDASQQDSASLYSGDTVAYRMEEIKMTSNTCLADSMCATYSVSYPVVLQEGRLKDSVTVLMRLIFGDCAGATGNLKNCAQQFVGSFDEMAMEARRAGIGFTQAWTSEDVVYPNEEGGIFALEVNSDVYTGGAHGMNTTSFYNLDVATGKLLSLGDVFTDQQQLAQRIQTSFNQEYGLPQGATLQQDPKGRFNSDAAIYPPNSWYLEGDTLHVLYNPYELAPYSYGSFGTSLFVGDLLKQPKPVM